MNFEHQLSARAPLKCKKMLSIINKHHKLISCMTIFILLMLLSMMRMKNLFLHHFVVFCASLTFVTTIVCCIKSKRTKTLIIIPGFLMITVVTVMLEDIYIGMLPICLFILAKAMFPSMITCTQISFPLTKIHHRKKILCTIINRMETPPL